MVNSMPKSAYVDSLLLSIRQEGLVHQRLCQLLFGIVDQFCARQPTRRGPGRPPTYPDSTILKLTLLMHLTGKRGETEILREAQRHYQDYFPALPCQSRLWHRIHQALPLLERFRCELCQALGVDREELRILDSFPVPVWVPYGRPQQGNGFDRAEVGYCATKHLHYAGFKVGMVMTPQGIPEVYDLFPARFMDVELLEDLLGDGHDIIALGDKGFISQFQQTLLKERQNVTLITYRRRNQKVRNRPIEDWLLRTFRQTIETVFSQLTEHMHIEDSGAKTDLGLVKRVVGILTAFTTGIYLNALLGRELLAVKELFA